MLSEAATGGNNKSSQEEIQKVQLRLYRKIKKASFEVGQTRKAQGRRTWRERMIELSA